MKDAGQYEYRFEDRSILLKALQRPLFGPVVRALPRTITPNQITLAGHAAIAAAFVLVVAGRPAGPLGLLGLAALALFYNLADCVDGAFARHTRQTSPLGEMLDHWLDAISVPLIVFCFGLALPADPRLVFAAALVTSFLHFATFLHGFRLRYVILGEIGIIEGIVVGAGFCVAAAFAGTGFLARPLAGGLSLASLLLAALVAGALPALWSMRGLARHGRDFGFITVLFGAASVWYACGALPLVPAGLLVIALGSRLEGQVIRARLLREPLALADPVLLVLVLGGTGASLALRLDARAQTLLAVLTLGYAFWREARSFAETVSALLASKAAAGPR